MKYLIKLLLDFSKVEIIIIYKHSFLILFEN